MSAKIRERELLQLPPAETMTTGQGAPHTTGAPILTGEIMKPRHVCIWRELPGFERRTDGTCVYCIVDAQENAERRERAGKPPTRVTETNHVEFLTERAAREFRRQRRMNLEPHFDNEGLVPVVIQQRSGPARADRKAK